MSSNLGLKPGGNVEESWIEVTSSVLSAVSYTSELCVLDIKFVSGTVYRYSNISRAMYKQLLMVESKGLWFSTYLRPYPDLYPFVEVKGVSKSEVEAETNPDRVRVRLQRLSHAFNLEGDLFTLELLDQQGQVSLLGVLQVAHYVGASWQTAGQQPSLDPLERTAGPTAICLYTVDGQPYATLSLRVAQSDSLPNSVFYGKHYSENRELFAWLLKAEVILPVSGYLAVPVGYAGEVNTYKLNPELFGQTGLNLN